MTEQLILDKQSFLKIYFRSYENYQAPVVHGKIFITFVNAVDSHKNQLNLQT